MATQPTSGSKQSLLLVLKWIVSVFFFCVAIASLTDKAVFSFLLFLLAGLLALPPLKTFWTTKLPVLGNKTVKRIIVIGLFVLGFVFNPTVRNKNGKNNEASASNTGSDEKTANPYQAYLDSSAKKLPFLTKESKEGRVDAFATLKDNKIYKAVIDSGVVSLAYMPCLTMIANAISTYNKDGYYLNGEDCESLLQSVDGKEKMTFLREVLFLINPFNGGATKEIIDMFDRYRKKYKFYGKGGVMRVDENGVKENVENDYDISPFFGMIDPQNKEVLNAIYEAKKQGFSQWSKQKNARYPYIASKAGYMDYVKQVYPESPYLLKVDAELTASQLYAAYDNNEVSADESYKGKKLAVTGVIEDISKDFTGDAKISLGVDLLQTIYCDFGDNGKILSRLNKGDRVTIVGTCTGFVLKQVTMDNCDVWEE